MSRITRAFSILAVLLVCGIISIQRVKTVKFSKRWKRLSFHLYEWGTWGKKICSEWANCWRAHLRNLFCSWSSLSFRPDLSSVREAREHGKWEISSADAMQHKSKTQRGNISNYARISYSSVPFFNCSENLVGAIFQDKKKEKKSEWTFTMV